MNNRFSSALIFTGAILLSGCNGGAKQNVGAATGGALGGYIGSQVGGGSGQLAATAAGAIAGALIGGSIGRSMDELDQIKSHRALESSRTGYTTSWHNPDSGADYAFTPTKTYQTSRGPCRDFATEADINGRTETVYGTACRQANGSWKTIN